MRVDKLRLVLVGVEGAVNLGMTARLVENFAVEELYLVSPKASLEEAREYAARAAHRLSSAVIVDSLREALGDASLSICTSSKTSETKPLRIPVTISEAVEIAKGYPGVVAVVMGRESVGLTRRELGECSLMAYIPASEAYPVLNLANATAIVLYEFYKARTGEKPLRTTADPRLLKLVEAYTRALAGVLVSDREKLEDIITAIRRIAAKSLIARREVEHLLYLLSRACRKIEGCSVEVPADV